MSVFDNPGGKLSWLEDALAEDEEAGFTEEAYEEEEEEEEEILPAPRTRRGRRQSHAVFADEEPLEDRDAVFVEKEKGKGTAGLKFLIFLEILGILTVIWWWIKWLY